MRDRRVVCVVVDGYSTGTGLAHAFASHGYDTVHVRSAGYLPDVLTRSFRPDDYVECHQLDSWDAADLDGLCALLTIGGRRVACVVPGAETGVRLADALAERVGCPTNGTALSGARRDKTLMSAAVAGAGLATIPQLCSGDPTQITAWVRERGLSTVVVKPPASSGTYGFHICEGTAELARTLPALLGSRDIFDAVVDEVIVQPYLTGTEFCVNAVSRDGRALISDIWLTRKRRLGPANVYDLEVLLPPPDPRWQLLAEYASGVLCALGIRHGPSHTEVMLTSVGPVLIETAARFMGSLDTALVTAATGTNAVLLTASAYLAPDRFAELCLQPPTPVTGFPAMVQMHATERGKLVRYRLSELAALDSYWGCDTYLQEGQEVVPTVNSYTSPGLSFLLANTAADRDADYRRIRELEQAGRLYEIS